MENKIVIGMSGGVDSSVAAYLLKEKGYDVIGVFMKNWEETDENGVCTATTDYDDVRLTASRIGIPYYTVNFAREYRERVFSYFLEEYKAGRTPNPDVLCNSEIKFKAFLDFALSFGADALATGHYARIESVDGAVRLKKAIDLTKDQSYFLAGLSGEQLKNAIFPLGNMKKTEVRKIAQRLELENANKKDSTGICFIGERNFKKFLMQYLPAKPGDIIDLSGKTLGRHDGLMYYTIGQRRGLNIGGLSGGNGKSFFVVDKDMKNNCLIVTQGEESSLFSNSVILKTLNFIVPNDEKENFTCNAKFRYRESDKKVRVQKIENGWHITCFEPERAVTPGQWAVLYDGDYCLGGGIIEKGLK
ncbi:MAG: tRNA 2-thiouridine(34) synthase MnmA [Clostridia bacterium]